MPRNQPKQLTGMVTASDIAVIGAEILVLLVNPAAGVPTVLATLLLALARGQTLLQYLEVVRSVTQTLESLTGLLVNLQALGLLGEPQDCCAQLKKIAEALRFMPDGGDEKTVAQIFQKIQESIVWESTPGEIIPLGESLGRLLFTGYYSSERQP